MLATCASTDLIVFGRGGVPAVPAAVARTAETIAAWDDNRNGRGSCAEGLPALSRVLQRSPARTVPGNAIVPSLPGTLPRLRHLRLSDSKEAKHHRVCYRHFGLRSVCRRGRCCTDKGNCRSTWQSIG